MRVFLLAAALAVPLPASAEPIRILNDDGGWCWYQDERAIVHNARLILGSIASGYLDPSRKGRVEATVFDLGSTEVTIIPFHVPDSPAEATRWLDDHNVPAFEVLPDGRVLAVYAKHGLDADIYYRTAADPASLRSWSAERTFVPSSTSRVTYSNVFYLAAEERLYNFFRGLHNSFKPSWMWSGDLADSWQTGGIFIDVPGEFRHRPYVKYSSNGHDTIHFAYTEGHPRNYDNGIYHAYYRAGQLHRSDGVVIRSLEEGMRQPEDGTRVFRGDPDNVAWISDLHVDDQGRPFLAYSVQKNSAGVPPERDGADHRYRLARWDGRRWHDEEIAYAGSRLYPGEDDYTGNIALDPHDPGIVFISTDADPRTGEPLISAADDRRHYEIYRGQRQSGGGWAWAAVTSSSAHDNIRPIVPVWPGNSYAILWLQGTMRTYRDYEFRIAAKIERRR